MMFRFLERGGRHHEMPAHHTLVRRVDRTSTGGQAYSVVGISEFVRDKEAMFLSEVETPVVLDPAATEIVVDPSPAYRTSLLYIESLLRQTAPTDDNLYIGHRAAMDPVPYQLDPAMQALAQPRPRILVTAHAVDIVADDDRRPSPGSTIPSRSDDAPSTSFPCSSWCHRGHRIRLSECVRQIGSSPDQPSILMDPKCRTRTHIERHPLGCRDRT